MANWLAVGFAVAAIAAGVPAFAQKIPVSAQARQGAEVLREIDDPANGGRWLLERDEEHPGGPGLLVLVEQGGPTRTAIRRKAAEAVPVIRAGDRVLVEAHTAVMDAELEGVATMPAAVGSEFAVRLKMGGRVLHALAVGPGRARWLESGAVE